jgi:uncharacterized membrane protein SirB2
LKRKSEASDFSPGRSHRLTDAQFRKLVPEAQDSLILLSGTSFEIISITLKKG